MIDIGPYDLWAIEYGYDIGDKPEEKTILKQARLRTGTDLRHRRGHHGPDPLARRYDFAADPLKPTPRSRWSSPVPARRG
jgi:hypothetical protein